jgi:hypothetical protein
LPLGWGPTNATQRGLLPSAFPFPLMLLFLNAEYLLFEGEALLKSSEWAIVARGLLLCKPHHKKSIYRERELMDATGSRRWNHQMRLAKHNLGLKLLSGLQFLMHIAKG